MKNKHPSELLVCLSDSIKEKTVQEYFILSGTVGDHIIVIMKHRKVELLINNSLNQSYL